jgi:hypothetical protein
MAGLLNLLKKPGAWVLGLLVEWLWKKWRRSQADTAELEAERKEFEAKVSAAELELDSALTKEDQEKAYAKLLALHRSRSSK